MIESSYGKSADPIALSKMLRPFKKASRSKNTASHRLFEIVQFPLNPPRVPVADCGHGQAGRSQR
jgi:hypothetical protein